MVEDSYLERQVRRAVDAVSHPELRRSLGELEMVREVAVQHGAASVSLVLPRVDDAAAEDSAQRARAAARSVEDVVAVEVKVSEMTAAERAVLVRHLVSHEGRRMPFGPGTSARVIAVTSGKGGVGKSTVTANLAVALAERGLSVGLVDADVHGYSIPRMLGLVDAEGAYPQPTRLERLMLPPVAREVKVISIGMFLRRASDGERPEAVMWRGPLLHRTLEQFLTDVYFGDLDVLLIDMPPGTGDVALSVGKMLPNAEVLVVATPQITASDVAIRSGRLAQQTGQRVIGAVENMAAVTLPDGTLSDVFGSGGGVFVASELSSANAEVRLLGSIPLSREVRENADAGIPILTAAPRTTVRSRRRGDWSMTSTFRKPRSTEPTGLSPSPGHLGTTRSHERSWNRAPRRGTGSSRTRTATAGEASGCCRSMPSGASDGAPRRRTSPTWIARR